MAYFTLVIPNEPNATAYDEAYPTRSTELYSHALHNIIQDMDDNAWILDDGKPSSTQMASIELFINTCLEAVYDYAANALTNFRDHGTPDVVKPTTALLGYSGYLASYTWGNRSLYQIYWRCYSAIWAIYFLWKFEDPIRLKEYIRDLLLAWPLNDVTVELNTEAGQNMRVYPSWAGIE